MMGCRSGWKINTKSLSRVSAFVTISPKADIPKSWRVSDAIGRTADVDPILQQVSGEAMP